MTRRDFLCASAAGAVAAGATWRAHAASAATEPQQQPPRPPGPAGNRVRIGIVGVGQRGGAIARSIPSVQGAELVAVADLYDGRLARAREVAGDALAATRDWRPMLDRKDVDAVVIATPDHQHAPIARAAIDAGKDVYCECPVAHTPDEARALADLARRRNRVFQGGGAWISSPVLGAVKDLISSGRLGRVTLVRATWDTSTALGAWLVPFPPDSSPDSIDYAAFAGASREFDPARFFRWRCYRAFGSGLAGARLAPQLTAIHWLLGASMPSRIAATGALLRWKDGREVPDTLHASLEYPEGFTALLSATQAGGTGRELRITGTEGTVSSDDHGFWFDDDTHAEPYPDVAESWAKEYRDWFYMMHGMTPQGQVRGTPAPEPSRTRYDVPQRVSATAAHLADFVDAVRARRPPRETPELAAGAVAAAMAIDTAAGLSPAREKR